MAKRGPGKFDSDLSAAIYTLSLDGGTDEDCGSSEGYGWGGLMRGGASIAKAIEENIAGVDQEDLRFLRNEAKAGVIFIERTDGGVEVAYYSDTQKLEADWEDVCEELTQNEETRQAEIEENRPRRRNSKLSDVSSKYGAPMGRRSGTVEGNVTLERVRINSGGYDTGGAYWGTGKPLWRAQDEDGNEKFFRAVDRAEAKAKLTDEGCTVVPSSAERQNEVEYSKLETDGTLAELLEQQAESTELPSEYWRDLEITPELSKMAVEYETALWTALTELVAKYPPEGDADANVLMEDGDAPYNVYLTLSGSGSGIQDNWSGFYDDETLENVEEFLEQRLGHDRGYVSDAGSGKLVRALDDAVYENERRLGIERDDANNVIEQEQEENGRRRNGQARFRVYLGEDLTDTVYFQDDMTEAEVRRSLIDHDGYDPRITVKKVEPRRTGIPAEAYIENRGRRRNRPWSRAHINDLPDSAFLYIEPGGHKEDDRTVPRSLRHFPYKDEHGRIDEAHLRNALSRIPQSRLPADVKRRVQEKAHALYAGRH